MVDPGSGGAAAATFPYRRTPTGLVLFVRLQPGASANRIEGSVRLDDGATVLRVRVTAAPEKGKANAALIKLLAKALGAPKSAIAIAGGATDRRKTLAIEGDPAALARRVDSWV